MFFTRMGNPIPRNGLLAEYLFLGNANDTSGNGKNGTLNGCTLTTGIKSQPNSAYSMNGSSDFIAIPNVELGENWCISAWINFNNITTTSYMFGGAGIGTASTGIRYSGTNFLVKTTSIGNSDTLAWTKTNVYVHFLCQKVDSTHFHIYINNEYLGELTEANATNLTLVYIGRRESGFYAPQTIDNVRAYNRNLTARERAALYLE